MQKIFESSVAAVKSQGNLQQRRSAEVREKVTGMNLLKSRGNALPDKNTNLPCIPEY